MQRFQQWMKTIGAQVRGLSSTSRMLVGSVMIILLMALFLVSLYAGGRTMAPLGLGANVGTDVRAKVIRYLSDRNIPYEENGGDVLVPVDQKYPVLASLNEQSLLQGDQINFEKLVADDSPFRSRDQNRQRYLVAKMNVLATMISQMSGIDRATVVIDQPEGTGGIGRAATGASASVTVLPRASELQQGQVDAIARLVAGAHAGLKVSSVMVVDARTGRALAARTDDRMGSSAYMDVKQAAESHVRQTLEGALAYIPGVMIAVNAQVDARQVTQQKHTVEEPKVGVTKESTTNSTMTSANNGGAPSVGANVGTSIAAVGSGGPSKTEERSDTSSLPVFPNGIDQIKDNKGYAVQINATVGVPKSYFVRLYADREGDPSKIPDQAALDALVPVETTKIKSDIQPLIDTGAVDGAVAGLLTVSMVPDFGLASTGTGAGGGVMGAGTAIADSGGSSGALDGLLSDGIIKYASLGGLALVSLVMMAMMVRRAGTAHEMPSAAELVGIPPALATAEGDLVGEADEASPALEGVEINDETLKRQQMLDQINDMITKAPSDAANLVRKWARTTA